VSEVGGLELCQGVRRQHEAGAEKGRERHSTVRGTWYS